MYSEAWLFFEQKQSMSGLRREGDRNRGAGVGAEEGKVTVVGLQNKWKIKENKMNVLRADTHVVRNKKEMRTNDNSFYFTSTVFKFCYCFLYKAFYEHVKTVHSMNVP